MANHKKPAAHIIILKDSHTKSGRPGFTDIHVHGVSPQGMTGMRSWHRALFFIIARKTGLKGIGPEQVEPYRLSLIQNLQTSKYVRRAVLLALDRVYDQQGSPLLTRADFSVDNDHVLSWCRANPELFLFGASIHPYRPDALDALDRVAEQGAVLIKWLPNSQGIDPARHALLPFYRKLRDLGLPLLCHTGFEFALPVHSQSFGQTRRLRVPLDEGVTVIAAHSGSAGLFYNRAALAVFAKMLKHYPNLYADTAGLSLPSHMEALLWWRGHQEMIDRLLFATDHPVPIMSPAWTPFLSRENHRRFRQEKNPFDRMALLLQGLGIRPHPAAFENLLQKLGRLPCPG